MPEFIYFLVVAWMLASLTPAAPDVTWHRVPISGLHDTIWTHVQSEGYVVKVINTEDDGDLHVWVCESMEYANKPFDRKHCFVAECMPELFCNVPDFGTKVQYRGNHRYDPESNHNWDEIHPVRGCTVLSKSTIMPNPTDTCDLLIYTRVPKRGRNGSNVHPHSEHTNR
jgi:hypothetical protein